MEGQDNGPLDALAQYFGHDAFLEGQEAVISRILHGEEMCVVMPTGAGKSLCYQLTAVMKPGYALIFSPLISLMKDQVDGLLRKNIPATFINSTMSPTEQQETMARVARNEVKMLYVAPERFRSQSFRRLLQTHPPSMAVIDEAHCISQWGHDFRPDYMRMGQHLQDLNIAQVCAFTATATPVVRADITTQLRRELSVFVTGFTRPNLAFSCLPTNSQERKIKQIQKMLAEEPAPTIIYAATRKVIDLLGAELGCIRYHAGMTDDERTQAQEHFTHDACPVVAATNAFGMGIDRPDVRRVIHFNIPGSLEAYYQEAGRAGRDGEDARCILFFSQQDRMIHEFFIEMSNPPPFVVTRVYQELRSRAMQENSNYLEVSQALLADVIPDVKGDQQISAALKVLEKYEYIVRGNRHQNRGQLSMQVSREEALRKFPRPDTQRGRMMHILLQRYGHELSLGVDITYEDLERLSGLDGDQVRRVIRALNGAELVWLPPFSGRGITLRKPQEATLAVSFEDEKRRAQLETDRLDIVCRYPHTHDCRQRYLISYFGQEPGEWRCRTCDLCSGETTASSRLPTTAEEELIVRVLTGVEALRGRFGRNRVAQFVTGSQSREIYDAGLHHLSGYGAVDCSSAEVLQLLDVLMRSGCVKRNGESKYPLVIITPLGREVMARSKRVPMVFPSSVVESAPAESAPAPATSGDHADLYERLRTVRDEMAAKRGVPAFKILNNGTLQALANLAPVTKEEGMAVKGIGAKNSRTVLPAFLREIRVWRQENAE